MISWQMTCLTSLAHQASMNENLPVLAQNENLFVWSMGQHVFYPQDLKFIQDPKLGK